MKTTLDLVIYARKEPTTDADTLKHFKSAASKFDTVLYYDREATCKAGVIPWHYSTTPRRSQKTIMHNCALYRLEWLD